MAAMACCGKQCMSTLRVFSYTFWPRVLPYLWWQQSCISSDCPAATLGA